VSDGTEILEYLDLRGGRSTTVDMHRRGIALDELAPLEADGLIARANGTVELTDRGAASLAGPIEPVAPPAAQETPEPAHADQPEVAEPAAAEEEETMETRSIEDHMKRTAGANGGGSTRDRILALLAEHPDGLRPKKIAELLGKTYTSVQQALRSAAQSGLVEAVPLGTRRSDGTLYFIAGEAKVPPAPDLKKTTSPKSKPPTKRRSKAPARRDDAVKPPPLRSRRPGALSGPARAALDDRGARRRGDRATRAHGRARPEGPRCG
jgi:DNA-binding transcriptional ArsR family regulator